MNPSGEIDKTQVHLVDGVKWLEDCEGAFAKGFVVELDTGAEGVNRGGFRRPGDGEGGAFCVGYFDADTHSWEDKTVSWLSMT